MMMAACWAVGGLFLSSFLAATLLPAQSELALAGLLSHDVAAPALLVGVATLGNTLGSLVNWLLGRWAHRLGERRWFPVKGDALRKAEAWYHRYGRWSLLLSWAPIIGDPLTLAAGLLREPLLPFLLLVGLAKLGRYLVIAWLVL
ncbi:YqaA family protein [uncultured Desulfovibrio sp.]|uniref:YqaA family protein n=1 Tax=uncultured Desulfovibrio sp. TaxID=167968 RepID=UPI003438E186